MPKEKLRIAIKQPYFFPWIGFWQELYAVDKYVVYDDVNFINRGWIHRNRILVNGQPKYFNLPMFGASQNKLISQIQVNNDTKEIHRNCCIIHDAYRKAPYYNIVFPVIEEILNCGRDNVAAFLTESIRIICRYLNIETELLVSSDIPKDCSLKAQDKILDICRVLNADEYIDSMGATGLYQKNAFEERGMKLWFLKTEVVNYQQFDNQFCGSLSIIDVMMFNSVAEIDEMLKKYELV